MGNNLAGRGNKKKAKVMKINGEIIKLETRTKVFDVIKDHPGHVLLESKSFQQYGIRASQLRPEEYLEAGKIYFLVELPKVPETLEKEAMTKRVKTRRTMSEDLVVRRVDNGGGSVQVKVRLPKAEVDKVIGESKDEEEVAERIVELYVQKKAGRDG